jgi:hypothetical protein
MQGKMLFEMKQKNKVLYGGVLTGLSDWRNGHSGTWKFPNLLSMTNETVGEPVSR